MNIGKLFGVLVIGGASLASNLGCSGTDGDTTPGTDAPAVAQQDSRPSIVDAIVGLDRNFVTDSASQPAADASVGVDVGASGDAALIDGGFCPNDTACEDGKLKKGFVCCWGTAC